MSSVRELGELTRARLLTFLREPEALFWVFAFPVLLALVLGYAFKERGTVTVRIGLLPGEGAAAVRASLEADSAIEVVPFEDEALARRKLYGGAVAILVRPRADAAPELVFDPQRPDAELAHLRVSDALQRGAGRRDPLALDVVRVEEAGSRYVDWLVPGLLGMNLMSTGLWSTAFALVNIRHRKLLKRFLVTPMRRGSYLMSFVLARLVFLIMEVAIILLFAWWLLGVPQRGSFLTLSWLCLLGGTAFAGLGILIGARAKTPEGVSGIMNLVMMPMWLCSGIFFSYERFPELLHPLIRALPLTALNDSLRDVMLAGDGFVQVLPEMGIQLAWGTVCFAAALRIFRWS